MCQVYSSLFRRIWPFIRPAQRIRAQIGTVCANLKRFSLSRRISAICHRSALQTCAVTLLRCSRRARRGFNCWAWRLIDRRRLTRLLIGHARRDAARYGLAETFNVVWRHKDRHLLALAIKDKDRQTIKTRGVQTLLRNVNAEHFFAGALHIDIAHNITCPRRGHRQEIHHLEATCASTAGFATP